MDKEFLYDLGLPSHLQFEPCPLSPPPSSSSMPTWNSLSPAMEIHHNDQPPSDQSSDCFLSPFESALSSLVSTPTTGSNSAVSNDSFMIRELIGKLGSICNNNNGEISPSSQQQQQQQQQHHRRLSVMNNNTCGGGGGNTPVNNTGASCYSTPLSSPPKRSIPTIMDRRHRLMKENFSQLGGSGNSIPPLSSNLPAMPGDPGFAERAARFSSFGSRSFNGRTSQLGGSDHSEFQYRSPTTNATTPLKLTRVSSSPSLIKAAAVGSSSVDQAEFHNSNRNPGVENGLRPANDSNSSRKRKSVPKGKPKENSPSTPPSNISTKGAENEDDSSPKRTKSNEGGGVGSNGNSQQVTKGGASDATMVVVEEDDDNDTKNEKNNNNQKPPEPPKDYIHVRARRGQATDSHSLAERVRRERISERMKLLQDLVPGCNKVTGKALMLDEIINYVQSLQRQVEFLSMKLASVNPRLEISMDNLISKDGFQPSCSHSQPMYPLDPLAPTLYDAAAGTSQQQSHQNNITSGVMTPCSQANHHDMQLPSLDGFSAAVSQLPSLCEGDLHSIVQMGYNPNPTQEIPFQSHSLHGPNQASLMKIEF